MATWVDATSYSRDERGKIEPRTWEHRTRSLRVTVTRHRDCAPDVWLLTCHDVGISLLELKSRGLEEAQTEALVFVRKRLERWAKELGDD
jgi:hypothetical protein